MKAKQLPHFSLPSSIETLIRWGLDQEGFSLAQPKPLAQAISHLSQIYLEGRPDSEVWTVPQNRAAYWAYFLPLNFLRLRRVFEEALDLSFFDQIQEVVDFGAGLGTGVLAWDQLGKRVSAHCYHSIERSSEPLRSLRSLSQQVPLVVPHQVHHESDLIPPAHGQNSSLALFSYSLNETNQLPSMLTEYSHLLILEPSTRVHGRQLMNWRRDLIQEGYFIWAPCTHQLTCPLLDQSKSDWCHDRILIQRPEWLIQIENPLPFENRSLTYSYLLAARRAPPSDLGARVIGDTLREKGKVRQATCRNSKREFLSWLKKDGKMPILPRGTRVTIPTDATLKGNEIRIGRNIQIASSYGRS